jgi:AcrR family transcriptional regulator
LDSLRSLLPCERSAPLARTNLDGAGTGSTRRRSRSAPSGMRGAARAKHVLERAVETETGILDAAVAAMSEKGYHETSMREIADRAGMSVANVYHYFTSKHALLFRLMDENAQLLIKGLEDALTAAGNDPREQLMQVTLVFASMHATRRELAFVTSSELRSLNDQARATVVGKRRRVEELFVNVITAGRDHGVFQVEDVELSMRMLLDMTRSLSAWYRPEGRLNVDEITHAYARAALVIVGAGGDD